MAAGRPISRGVGRVRRPEGRLDGRTVPRRSDRRGVRGNRGEDALQQRPRRGRTAGNRDIDRYHAGDAAEAGVALAEDAATAAAVADGDDQLGLGRRVVGALERDRHVLRYRAGHQQHVGVARTRDKAYADTLEVVVRIGQRLDLELAAVARAG